MVSNLFEHRLHISILKNRDFNEYFDSNKEPVLFVALIEHLLGSLLAWGLHFTILEVIVNLIIMKKSTRHRATQNSFHKDSKMERRGKFLKFFYRRKEAICPTLWKIIVNPKNLMLP